MNPSQVFNSRTKKDFEKAALSVFLLQAEKNPVYKEYIHQLGIMPSAIQSVSQIPFLPIEFFKTHKVMVDGDNSAFRAQVFLSSGTTGMERSEHRVTDISLYEKSVRKCFDIFYGDIKQYAILALLPSYYENKNSSLIYMVMDMIKESGNRHSVFFNSRDENLTPMIQTLLQQKQKVIVFGVSFALMDIMPPIKEKSKNLIIIETGGMKGKRQELTRDELHKLLSEKFGVKKIHSEYGMTELLSQAYSKGDGIFFCPPWMKVFIRDINDPFSRLPAGKTGGINVIDLANINSCSFIATQDLGKAYGNGSFEVLGRIDTSDLRGCNLLVT